MKKLLPFIVLLFASNALAQQPVQGTGTAGSPAGNVLTVQGATSGTAMPVSCSTAATCPSLVTGTGTFATQSAVTAASGSIASGAIASGACASGCVADGGVVTLGAKADAKNAATDTTAITAMQVLKEISSLEQAPASRAVTNVGTFATQSAVTAASGSIASGSIASGACALGCIADGGEVTLGAKADAKSAATDTTAITIMQVLKEISSLEQAPASRAVTNAGTFAVQNTAATPAGTNTIGSVKTTDGTNTAVIDPCAGQTKIFININQATNTKLVTGTSSKKIYICSFTIQPLAAATNIALVEGTGSVCGTMTVAVPGVTGGDGTAAKGANFAINGGETFGNGASAFGAESVAADDLCLFQSGSGQTSGGLSYVVQ